MSFIIVIIPMMCKIILLFFVTYLNILCCECLGIFHENTRITFYADDVADYFGYSVLLNHTGLYVGAPKARSRINKFYSPGLVFTCPIDNLKNKNVTCKPFNLYTQTRSDGHLNINDAWFGAVLALVPGGKLLVCAPRWSIYSYLYKDNLISGACYVYGQGVGQWLLPSEEMVHISKEWDKLEFDFAQAGMSAVVTEGSTLFIGTPGLFWWFGGTVEYKWNSNAFAPFHPGPSWKLSSVNKYGAEKDFEKFVGLLYYLGYSVSSGKFDKSGNILHVTGGPNSQNGYGQVVIFEKSILNIKANVTGPHMGSYFGATILCADVNGDGVVDLLVGAPNYVKNIRQSYDQGAVFVYVTERQYKSFVLQKAGVVMGSEEIGARFGTAIAELGDVDDDGFTDIAIGAPWDNNGIGAVYIYKGSATGLKTSYVQKISASDARGFGFSISKGLDVDSNNCNDLAVGAFQSGTTYLFRCIPTMQVSAVIKVPDITNLPQNITNFTASFCVTALGRKMWPYIKIDLRAKITVDPMLNRADIFEKSEYNIIVNPGSNICEERTIIMVPTADMSQPIPIQLNLMPIEVMKDDSSVFSKDAVRLSDDSVLERNVKMQLARGCGEDLICRPVFTMTFEPLVNPYVPGSDDMLGFTIKVTNDAEPGYGAKVYLQLPSNPKRLPIECILDKLNVTCNVPSPLYEKQSVSWVIEIEPTLQGIIDKELKVFAKLENSFNKNITFEEFKITVTPISNISISSKAMPNNTIPVTRNYFNEAGNVDFVHYYQVTNFGPSDCYHLSAVLEIPDQVNITSPVIGCLRDFNKMECSWSLPAKESLSIILPLRFDLGVNRDYFEENTPLNITSVIEILSEDRNQSLSTTTRLILELTQPVWPLIVGLIAGFILLAAIVFGLYKCGFFSRTSRDELTKLQEQGSPQDNQHNLTSSLDNLLSNETEVGDELVELHS